MFHVFCDSKAIPEADRAPASQTLVAAYVAAAAGLYSGKTIQGYVSGIRAWHVLHGIAWRLNEVEMAALLKGATKLAPSSTKRSARRPVTLTDIASIREQLNLADPLDVAVYACLTTTFYTAARLGEFTIRTLEGFDPASHVKPSDVREEQDRNGLRVVVFHIPKTKSSPQGEDLSWAKQEGPSDPEEAWNNHQRINAPPPQGHLFAYKFKDAHRPLTKTKFLQRLAQAVKAAKLTPLHGHGIRIGATLEYLLRGMPFDVMKVKGRWASDAFALYLTKHAQILAPYIQGNTQVHEAVVRYTMPPVR